MYFLHFNYTIIESTCIIPDKRLAHACKYVVSHLKGPSSFVIREGLYIAESELLLEISGKNRYGGYTTNYWLFEYDEDSRTFEYYECLTDLPASSSSTELTDSYSQI